MCLLKTTNLAKNFGALRAVNDVSIRVEENTIHALIGPNGAGKTTLFNIIAGVFPPSSGTVAFKGQDITNLKISERSRLGIGRSYQVVSVFPELTVRENIRLAVQSREHISLKLFRDAGGFRSVEEKTERILDEMALGDTALRRASTISHGHQRSLEIGIAIATDPVLLLLDEPTAGLPPEEAFRMMKLIKRVSKGITALLIEHNMKIVMEISDRITVLQQGEVIAEGSPREVRASEEVIRAYLGRSYAAAT